MSDLNGFICESCDDPFLSDFGEEFEYKHKGKKRVGMLCLMCALRDKLDKVSEKFPIDEVVVEREEFPYTPAYKSLLEKLKSRRGNDDPIPDSGIRERVVFTPIQRLLLDTCIDEFNKKHNSKLTLDLYEFAVTKHGNNDVCWIAGEAGNSIQIRYEHMAEAEIAYNKWMREEKSKKLKP